MTALRAELQATINAAAAGERQVLMTCAESDLLAGGVLFGVGRRMPAAAPDADDLRALAERVQRSEQSGGPLADVLTLDRGRRRQLSYLRSEPLVANGVSACTYARITVLTPDAEVTMVLSGSTVADAPDLPVTVEVVRW